jgi:hypothetical protein
MAQSDEKCDEISKIQQTYSIQFQQQSTQRKFFKLSKQEEDYKNKIRNLERKA